MELTQRFQVAFVVAILLLTEIHRIECGSLIKDIAILSFLAKLLKPRFVPLPLPIPLPIKLQKHTHKPYPVFTHSHSLSAHHVPDLHLPAHHDYSALESHHFPHHHDLSGHHAFEELHATSHNIESFVEALSHSHHAAGGHSHHAAGGHSHHDLDLLKGSHSHNVETIADFGDFGGHLGLGDHEEWKHLLL